MPPRWPRSGRTRCVRISRATGRPRSTATSCAAIAAGFRARPLSSWVAQRDEGEVASARDAFAAALALAPAYVEARIAAVNAAIAAGDLETAVAMGEQGLAARARRMPGLLRALGRAHLARRDGAAAAAAFDGALRIDPARRRNPLQPRRRAADAAHFAEAARAYQRALAFAPTLVAAHFNLGVLFQEQGPDRRGDRRVRAVLRRDPAATSRPTRTWAKCCFAAGQRSTRARELPALRGALPECAGARGAGARGLAVQHGDFARVERYLDGLSHEAFRRRRRDRARRRAGAAPLSAAVSSTSSRADAEPRAHLRRGRPARLRRADAAPGGAAPGRVRIGYLSADLRNHVMGKMVWAAVEHHDRALRALLLFAFRGRRRMDGEVSRRSPIASHCFAGTFRNATRRSASRPTISTCSSTSRRTRRARSPESSRASRPACRSRMSRVRAPSACRRSISSSPTAYADLPANQAFQIETLLPMDGLRLPVSARRAGDRASVPPGRARHCRRDAVVIGAFVSALKLSRRCLALWREVLERIPQAQARVLAGQPGAARAVFEIACSPPAASRPSASFHSAGARRRRESGALRARRFRARHHAVSAASTARSKRSTWACRW